VQKVPSTIEAEWVPTCSTLSREARSQDDYRERWRARPKGSTLDPRNGDPSQHRFGGHSPVSRC
jgi:hypothetical protein